MNIGIKKTAYKIMLNALNIIYYFLKKHKVRNQIVFISREYDEKSIDFQILEEKLKEAYSDTKLLFLCKTVPDNLIGKIGYAFHLLRQMRVISVSRAVILDTYCFSISALKQRDSLIVIQIWHAMGSLKKFGWSITEKKEGRDPLTAELMCMHRNYTYYTVSSEACIPGFDEAYGYDKSGPNFDGIDHAVIAPLPRVERYMDEQYIAEAERRVFDRYPEWKGERLAVFVPTFRTGTDISGEIKEMKKALLDYRLIVKCHPIMTISDEDITVDHCFSAYELMCVADCIIFDYSAAVFEAVLLDKPLVFYPYDYDEYLETRDFYMDYMSEMPGPIARTPEELAEIIKEISKGYFYDRRKIRSFREKWVDTNKTGTSEIIKLLSD